MARGPEPGPARGVPPGRLVLLLLLLNTGHLSGVSSAQELNGFSLHPPYFNLAEGTRITASATCGEDGARSVTDLYCKLVGGPVSGDPSQTIQGQYCDVCSQNNGDRAHPITNAIDGTERWWQSPPLSRSTEFNQVNVTLDLGQLFHVAYVLIKFANSPRPDLWVLERSVDFGETYRPWQFFASSKRDCIERFGQQTIERIHHDDDVICTTEYSRIVPLENGEVVVSLVNGRPGAMNFSYSPVLRDFTKATNIRLRFLRTNTLLGHLMGKALRDPTVTRRYYYSIKDISIGGRCVCNGHAEACNAKDPNDPYKLQCDCQHNTCGLSCDQCCPGYSQSPWKPATTYNANECEQCNCHRHSFDCYYDPEVEQRRVSLNVNGQLQGGGVCLNCQHHTTGVNCERCIPTYYRSPDHPIDSPLACSRCACESEFTDGTCEDLTGRCLCKPGYSGERCDNCADGFLNFPECYRDNNNGEAKPAGEIINCECSAAGTLENSCRQDPRTRTCVCKPGFSGVHCDTCSPGHHGLTCQACQCSGPGCLDGSCDSVDRSTCDKCAPGYFNYPLCQLCGCSAVGSLPAGCDVTGHCLCRPEFTGPRCDQCRSGFHSYPNCQECTCDPRTALDASCSASGLCRCRPDFSGPSCDQCAPGYYGYPSCTPCHCSSEGSRYAGCDQVSGQCVCLPAVGGLRCDTCTEGTYGFPHCQAGSCHPAGSIQYQVQPEEGQCECRENVEGRACDRCKALFWNLSPDTPDGCSSCECNTIGTISGVAECAQSTGQCPCRPGVCSGTCSVCKDGFFNLQEGNFFGCQGCQCDIGGAAGQSCGERNGRCRCRPNVEGPKCNTPRVDHYFPDLHHMRVEVEEGTMLDGRPVRFGFDTLEFEGFSWKGYAQMSSIQSRVWFSVSVGSPDLFRVVLHYVNRGLSEVRGRVVIIEDGRPPFCGNCSEQSKQIVFAPSLDPTFVNVPQNSFVEPFVLNPGTWTVVIEAEDILLDYMVLLPSAYYEAPILQLRVTEPCHYSAGFSLFSSFYPECSCSACGTESCDPQSGQCRCKPGVTGKLCDRCLDGFYGYDSCGGCHGCECGAAAALVRSCDPASGQCACRPGVNGPGCQQCAAGYWDYGPQGCKKCPCKGGRCDPRTGECRCGDGLTGPQCDTCSDAHHVAVQEDHLMHCEACDSCVIVLLEDLDTTNTKFLSVANQMGSLNASSMAWAQLHNLNTTMEDVSVRTKEDDGERARKMREVEAMLREMRFRSCVGQKKLADRERTEANKLLSRVREGLVTRQTNNTELAQDLRERLARFQQQMMDLRDLLNQAVNTTAQAAQTNQASLNALEDNQVGALSLWANQKEVEDLLQMAEDDVAQVNDLLSMLHESKEEYERLAAQLDGARVPLADKVQAFAPAAAKVPLVEQAEEHARLLDRMATNLTRLIAGTNEDGFIGRALNASRAYNDIIRSVAEAEDAANKAHQAAMDATAVRQRPEVTCVCVCSDLEPKVRDARRRLDDARVKQEDLQKELEEIQKNLNTTSDVSQDIADAKSKAEQANSTATRVLQALGPMKEQLDKWNQSYGDANTTNEDINNALMEANKTVSMLTETFPLLLKKLDKLQNHSAQMPNISENIGRIRQLIEQARKAASKVSVPVKFNGMAGVQVRNPGNLADLAAYTSLKFFITLPEGARNRRQGNVPKQFVFYLGNKDSSKEFLGMALEGKRLRWYFNVGGETADVLMQEEVKSDGTFNNVVLERILQYGGMSMSSEKSDGGQEVAKARVEAGGDMGLLNLLTTDTVFYVGGYPPTFKPPPQLLLPHFQGCVELETLNEEVLSLYNFEKVFNLNTTENKPCGRSDPNPPLSWVNDAAYFDGSGYAEVVFKENLAPIQRYELEVKLLSHNGILLMLHNEVGFRVRGQGKKVVVRKGKNVLFLTVFPETIPPFGNSYYLGGVPKDSMPPVLRALFPVQGSLKGCFRSLKAMTSHIDLKRMKSSGVSFGCNNDLLVAREAHFSGQSYLDIDHSDIPGLRDNFYAGFGFRTEQKAGLMLYHQAKDGVCQVFLDKGHVVVRAGNSEVRSQTALNDNNSHYVALYSNSNGMRLYVDDSLVKAGDGGRAAGNGPSVSAATSGSFYLGGTPDQSTGNLTGCISNLFIKRYRLLSFHCLTWCHMVSSSVHWPGLESMVRPGNKKPAGSRSRSTRESCQGEPSPPETGATHFSGSAHSHQRHNNLPREFSKSPHISLGVRINSSEGLVLRTTQQGGGAVMSLRVSEGHLVLLVEGGKRKASLRSRRKYSDNQWHTVFIKRDGDKISLVVDGINALSKKLPGGDKFRLSGPLYVGGAPGAGGMVGCVRGLKLNEVPAGSPSHSQGAAPCFLSLLHPGAYFSREGGHIAIDDSVVLGKDLEVRLEIRARSDSGLLLHAGTSEHFFNVVLNQGEVTVTLNSGSGVFSTPLTPEVSICDGHWHTLSVMKRSSVLQIQVDGVSQSSIGPKASRSAGGKLTLYLGGAPDGAVVPGLPAGLPSFHGCVRKASLNQRAVPLNKPLALHGAVGTQGCPHD
uniref:Laminin subunit alpha-5 n=1 Tax=Gadus morhua TaxID=8049 RepID=A0A8C4Z2D7_GADMO